MRCRIIVFAVLTLCLCSAAQDQGARILPDEFEVGRRTFFDFGPPFDFYELFLVRSAPNGISLERITLTPAADTCTQPAKVEVATGSLAESVGALLGKTNPCSIPGKELHRELKRCEKCVVFSGANVAMQVQCGSHTRIVRADILDRDMFDSSPNTPEHTSWTMRLLGQIDGAIRPGVMQRPMFAIPGEEKKDSSLPDSATMSDISSGKYDVLFQGAPDKLSDLYHAAQIAPPVPTIRLVSSAPFQPKAFVPPGYPPIARLARIEGTVNFTVDVDPDGSAINFSVESGHPMLRGVTEKAVSSWKFPKEAGGQKISAAIEFVTNCPAKNH